MEFNKIGGEFQESPEPLRATPVYETQHTPAATELRVISQPSGDANLNKYKNYVYRSRAGKESFIYHIEMGINRDHNEFRGRQGEWVFTHSAILARQNVKNETAISAGHSTCTASKAFGNLYGAAKYAALVVVKMPDLSDASMLDGLNAAYHHIRMHNRGTRSVLSISWGSKKIYKRGDDLDNWGNRMRDILRWLAQEGVITVCAAGNHAQERVGRGTRLAVDTLPAAFDLGSVIQHKAPVIAVGNCILSGKRYFESQILHPGTQIHAPGVGSLCADSISQDGRSSFTGTSFCECWRPFPMTLRTSYRYELKALTLRHKLPRSSLGSSQVSFHYQTLGTNGVREPMSSTSSAGPAQTAAKSCYGTESIKPTISLSTLTMTVG